MNYFRIAFISLLILTISIDSNAQFRIFKKKGRKAKEEKVKPDTLIKKSDKVFKPAYELKNTYNIAIMLPFYLDDIDEGMEELNYYYEIDESEHEMEPIVPQVKIYSKSKLALAFYEGILVALDSLEQVGLKAKVIVFDTKNDTSVVKNLLRSSQMSNIDMIIGPIYNKNVKLASKFALEKKVPLISPLSSSPIALKSNPYFVMSTPTVYTQCNSLVDFALSHFEGYDFYMIRENRYSEKYVTNIIKTYYNVHTIKSSSRDSSKNSGESKLKEIIYSDLDKDDFINNFSDNSKQFLIFIPSSNEAFVSKVMSKIHDKSDSNIVVLGLPNWIRFESIRTNVLQDLMVHLPSTFNVEYQDTAVVKFRKKYLNKFNSEPSKYSYCGYDVFYYYTSLLYKYGSGFFEKLLETQSSLHNSWEHKRRNKTTGIENGYVNIVQFKDFSLQKIE